MKVRIVSLHTASFIVRCFRQEIKPQLYCNFELLYLHFTLVLCEAQINKEHHDYSFARIYLICVSIII